MKRGIKTPSAKTSAPNPQIALLEEKLARSLADYSNLEKRIDRERQLYVTLATVSIISKMITILDDLYLTAEHVKDDGLNLTITKFIDVLKSEGLAEINTSLGTFDPNTMECISTAPGKENTILKVAKKGYTLNGQVIRPAQVIVGKTDQIKN